MPDNPQTTTDPNALNGASKSQALPKKQRRRALPNATASSIARAEVTIKAVVSSTPKSVSDDAFPLYRLFALDASGNGELFIKISKVRIVNVSTGDFYNPNVSGYLLSV